MKKGPEPSNDFKGKLKNYEDKIKDLEKEIEVKHEEMNMMDGLIKAQITDHEADPSGQQVASRE